MYEHILVPVDGTELSQKAMHDSVDLAKMLGARITGFTVELPLPVVLMMGEAAGAVSFQAQAVADHQSHCEVHARTTLKAFADMAQAVGVPFEGHFMMTDQVAHAIVDLAREKECDLIVMATHGRHGLDALINGSLTKSVLSQSKIPLLVIH